MNIALNFMILRYFLAVFALLYINPTHAQLNNLQDALGRILKPQESVPSAKLAGADFEAANDKTKVGIGDIWLGMDFTSFIDNQFPKVKSEEYVFYEVKDGKIGKGSKYVEDKFGCRRVDEPKESKLITCSKYKISLFGVATAFRLDFYKNKLLDINLNGFPQESNYGKKEFVRNFYNSLRKKFGEPTKLYYGPMLYEDLSDENFKDKKEAMNLCVNYWTVTKQMLPADAVGYCDQCKFKSNSSDQRINKCNGDDRSFVDLRPLYDKYKSGTAGDIVNLDEIPKNLSQI